MKLAAEEVEEDDDEEIIIIIIMIIIMAELQVIASVRRLAEGEGENTHNPLLAASDEIKERKQNNKRAAFSLGWSFNIYGQQQLLSRLLLLAKLGQADHFRGRSSSRRPK